MPGGDWFNQVTNELLNVLAAAGIDPSKADDDQLLQAIHGISKAMSAREALRRTYAEAGFTLVPGSFELGGTVTAASEVLLYEADGHAYSWDGTFPVGGKVVPQGSTPATTGGVGPGLWLGKHSETLRDQHAAPNGSSQIGFEQPEVGAVPRTLLEKSQDVRSTPDYGAVGDGVEDDTAAFAVMSALAGGKPIDGLGRIYLVTVIPTAGVFFNGFWKVGTTVTPFEYVSEIRASNTCIAIGPNAAPNYMADDFIAIGNNAGMSAVDARNCIAIGKGAMLSNVVGRHNIAIGLEALRSVNGLSPSSFEGSRNIGIGGNSGRFLTTGNRNILMGRDVAHGLTTGTNNVVIGNAAMMGDGPNTLDPGVIINQTPLTGNRNIQIGVESGKWYNDADAVMVGYQAGLNVKSATGLVAVGANAFAKFQQDRSYWGTTQLVVNTACTYSQTTSTTITIVSTAHGLSNGYKVWLRFTTGAHADTTFLDDIWFDVTVVDANTFTIQSPVIAAASGNAEYTKIATTTPYTSLNGESVGVGRDVGNGTNSYRSVGVGDRVGAQGLGSENTGVGYHVFNLNTPGSANTAVGAYSQEKVTATASQNVSVGVFSLGNLTAGSSNTSVGTQSGRQMTTGGNNTCVGINAARGVTTASFNTAVGSDSLRYVSGGGTTDSNFTNASGFGYQAYVSGDNQVQLGNSTSTTYVYGTVQNRSDERDKADIQNTQLGIEFIMGLRPVDGRWDMRDDYVEAYEVQTGIDIETAQPIFETRLRKLDKDGSKKRNRLHHWFVAQEVKALCDQLGVEFGGYQDHAVNGGCDVLSLGYDEFIPPAVKAIQQCWERMDAIEARLTSGGL